MSGTSEVSSHWACGSKSAFAMFIWVRGGMLRTQAAVAFSYFLTDKKGRLQFFRVDLGKPVSQKSRGYGGILECLGILKKFHFPKISFYLDLLSSPPRGSGLGAVLLLVTTRAMPNLLCMDFIDTWGGIPWSRHHAEYKKTRF